MIPNLIRSWRNENKIFNKYDGLDNKYGLDI